MDAFVELPSFATAAAGFGEISLGFLTTFSPLVMWAMGTTLCVGVIVIFYFFAMQSINKMSFPKAPDNPYQMENTFHGIQKKNDNWIKAGSIEDLANKHYGRVGREKELGDRFFSAYKAKMAKYKQ